MGKIRENHSHLASITLTAAKKNLRGLMDSIQVNHGAYVITMHGVPSAVLMSYDAYEGLKETLAVCSDPALMTEIQIGLNDLRTKKAHLCSLNELFSGKEYP